MAAARATVSEPHQIADDVGHDHIPNVSQLTLVEEATSLPPTPVGPSVPRADKSEEKGKERKGTKNDISNYCVEDTKALLYLVK